LTAFPILQFGTSPFLQAHVDLFVSQALARGEAMGRVAVVQTTLSRESRKRLDAFAAGKPYLVNVKGLSREKIVDESIEVTSVAAGFDAASQWDEVERLFNAARCAVSNTADRGYDTDPADRPDAKPPRSFPAKLAKLLLARHHVGAEPITIFPCEQTPANGKILRATVLGVLDRWGVPAKARQWVGDDCVWINSLVDRIVSEPLEPVGAVAEPYALWAIEGQPGLELPCRHASITVTRDLKPYERLKLFILNLGHTYLAEIWARGGLAPTLPSAKRWRMRRPALSSTISMMRRCCRYSPASEWAARPILIGRPSLNGSQTLSSITTSTTSTPTMTPRSDGASGGSSSSPEANGVRVAQPRLRAALANGS
jgi:tagaturonate reductase